MIRFILILTEAGKEHDIMHELDDIEEIEDLHLVFGKYDFIAKTDIDDAIQFHKVISKIRKIEGVEEFEILEIGDV